MAALRLDPLEVDVVFRIFAGGVGINERVARKTDISDAAGPIAG